MAEKKFKPITELTWQDMRFMNIILDSGNDSEYKTGGWRYQRPVLDKDKCIKCGMCWLYCPDCSIALIEDGSYEPDLLYCKGCGICAQECPKDALTMVEEKM